MRIIRILLLICAVLAEGLFGVSETIAWRQRDVAARQWPADTDVKQCPAPARDGVGGRG